jgi:hypothetical protein
MHGQKNIKLWTLSVTYPNLVQDFIFKIMFWCREGVVDGVLGNAVGWFYFILGYLSMAKYVFWLLCTAFFLLSQNITVKKLQVGVFFLLV